MESIAYDSSDGAGDKDKDTTKDEIHILRQPEKLSRRQICRLFSARKIHLDELDMIPPVDAVRLLELYNQYLLPSPQRSYCQRHREGRRLHAKRSQFNAKRKREDRVQDLYLDSLLQEEKYAQSSSSSFAGSKRSHIGSDINPSSISQPSNSKRQKISWP